MNSFRYINCEIKNNIGYININNPPHNFFNLEMISNISSALKLMDNDSKVRVVLLYTNSKNFCAGADFNADRERKYNGEINPLYLEAIQIFSFSKPIVAAIDGAVIGGGLGLALTADFRFACEQARFSANFNRLGFHPGFALSYTLPELIGKQAAAWMFYTGSRIDGNKAYKLGLVDFLAEKHKVLQEAEKFAIEIAISSPRAVQSTRKTLKKGVLDKVREAVERESLIQSGQFMSQDLIEGVLAMNEKRPPHFVD